MFDYLYDNTCVSLRRTYTCTVSVFMNDSLGLFSRLIIKGDKLEEWPPGGLPKL